MTDPAREAAEKPRGHCERCKSISWGRDRVDGAVIETYRCDECLRRFVPHDDIRAAIEAEREACAEILEESKRLAQAACLDELVGIYHRHAVRIRSRSDSGASRRNRCGADRMTLEEWAETIRDGIADAPRGSDLEWSVIVNTLADMLEEEREARLMLSTEYPDQDATYPDRVIALDKDGNVVVSFHPSDPWEDLENFIRAVNEAGSRSDSGEADLNRPMAAIVHRWQPTGQTPCGLDLEAVDHNQEQMVEGDLMRAVTCKKCLSAKTLVSLVATKPRLGSASAAEQPS